MQLVAPGAALFGQGRANLVKDLLDGDPFALSIVIGMVVIFGLALAVSTLYRRPASAPGSADPAEIVARWKTQRGRSTAAAVVMLSGIVVGALIGLALLSPTAMLIVIFPIFFVSLVVILVNRKCPACGSGVGRESNPRFCPKCGVQLQETEPTQKADGPARGPDENDPAMTRPPDLSGD